MQSQKDTKAQTVNSMHFASQAPIKHLHQNKELVKVFSVIAFISDGSSINFYIAPRGIVDFV